MATWLLQFDTFAAANGCDDIAKVKELPTSSVAEPQLTILLLVACEQAHLRENWGKEKKGEGGGGGKMNLQG